MKFKLDENLGKREVGFVRAGGHDAVGVRDQGLAGVADPRVLDVCAREERALITLDRGFGNVLRFPPERFHGIVILELPHQTTPNVITERLQDFLSILAKRPLGRELWIVEPGRVRVHQREES